MATSGAPIVETGNAVARSSVLPPLEAGDRLSREEFERRYESMPHLKKAELIEGTVYMPSPVRAKTAFPASQPPCRVASDLRLGDPRGRVLR